MLLSRNLRHRRLRHTDFERLCALDEPPTEANSTRAAKAAWASAAAAIREEGPRQRQRQRERQREREQQRQRHRQLCTARVVCGWQGGSEQRGRRASAEPGLVPALDVRHARDGRRREPPDAHRHLHLQQGELSYALIAELLRSCSSYMYTTTTHFFH